MSPAFCCHIPKRAWMARRSVLGQQLSDTALQLAPFRFGSAKPPRPIERDWELCAIGTESQAGFPPAPPDDLRDEGAALLGNQQIDLVGQQRGIVEFDLHA